MGIGRLRTCILISLTPRLLSFKDWFANMLFLDGMRYAFEIVANKIIISVFITSNVHQSIKAPYDETMNM